MGRLPRFILHFRSGLKTHVSPTILHLRPFQFLPHPEMLLDLYGHLFGRSHHSATLLPLATISLRLDSLWTSLFFSLPSCTCTTRSLPDIRPFSATAFPLLIHAGPVVRFAQRTAFSHMVAAGHHTPLDSYHYTDQTTFLPFSHVPFYVHFRIFTAMTPVPLPNAILPTTRGPHIPLHLCWFTATFTWTSLFTAGFLRTATCAAFLPPRTRTTLHSFPHCEQNAARATPPTCVCTCCGAVEFWTAPATAATPRCTAHPVSRPTYRYGGRLFSVFGLRCDHRRHHARYVTIFDVYTTTPRFHSLTARTVCLRTPRYHTTPRLRYSRHT